jgi:hypothetical protein
MRMLVLILRFRLGRELVSAAVTDVFDVTALTEHYTARDMYLCTT